MHFSLRNLFLQRRLASLQKDAMGAHLRIFYDLEFAAPFRAAGAVRPPSQPADNRKSTGMRRCAGHHSQVPNKPSDDDGDERDDDGDEGDGVEVCL